MSTFEENYIRRIVRAYVDKHLPFDRLDEFGGTPLKDLVDKIVIDRSDISEELVSRGEAPLGITRIQSED